MSSERPTTPDVEKGPAGERGPAFSPEETALIFGTGETLDERVEAVHSKVERVNDDVRRVDSEVKEIKTRVGNVEAGLVRSPEGSGGGESPAPPEGGAPGGRSSPSPRLERPRGAGGQGGVESAFDLF